MSRARALTIGTSRPRGPQPDGTDWAALRRLTRAERPDLETFHAILARTAVQRVTQEREAVWQAANARYEEVAG